ncbi:Protease 2 [Hordeum vulgare]|nr:Protease 2 [Hordeum vulgare]
MGALPTPHDSEDDARRLRRKNAKALWLAIEQSEREAGEAAEEKARLTRIVIDASNTYSQPSTRQENEVELHAPNACSQPPISHANEVDMIASEKVIQEDGDGDVDGDLDELQKGFHVIDVRDLDAYITQKEMDHELPFKRLYGYGSDDEGIEEELDEDGFTKEENQIHFELTGLEKINHLFRDLDHGHKAIVDGGVRNTAIEPTPCPDPGKPREENEDENAYLKKGVKFLTLAHMKVWLCEYGIRNHMPYCVEHSDIN